MDAVKLTLLLLFSALYLVLLPTQATDVKYCDKKGNYAVKVNGVEISPNPVVSGKPATFNISASTGDLEIFLQHFWDFLGYAIWDCGSSILLGWWVPKY
uniref:MD-2-related lipid-recognition domain-containing protein n=1 Tax=Fagus sylvatica TaxID=28930 RepID=A0A2N9H592_FAGSY